MVIGDYKQRLPLIWAIEDIVPVVLFFIAGTIAIRGCGISDPFFPLGVDMMVAGAVFKVIQKISESLRDRDYDNFRRPFLMLMVIGMALLIVFVVRHVNEIAWSQLMQMPGGLFIGIWIVLLLAMAIYRFTKFDDSVKANITAQIINTVAQACLLVGVCLNV